MQSSDLSIYFVIGSPPNEFSDSCRIDGYFPLSSSLLINSISRFYDLPQNNFQILGIGQKKDYTLLKHTNKAYYQFGNDKDDFYTISADQNIKFKLFQHISDLFDFLESQILKNSSTNILIILQDQIDKFNKYPHFKLLRLISKFDKRNFLIYDDSCNGGSLIDLFQKNQTLFSYIQNHELNIKRSNITCLYYFSLFQLKMFEVFGDNISTFFPKCIDFISDLSDDLLDDSIYNVIVEILNAFDRQIQGQEKKKFFLTSINEDFFCKLKSISNFDILQCIIENKLKFPDLDSFLTFFQNNNIKNLANLLMLKSYYLFTSEPDKQFISDLSYFSKKNYKFFFNIESKVFPISVKNHFPIEEQRQLYNQIVDFFYQYFHYKIIFFDCKSNVDFITSTSLDKTSLSYSSNKTNSITQFFSNTHLFAYFIKNVFFTYDKPNFSFSNLEKNTYYYNPTTTKYIFFQSYRYQKYEKPTSKVQPIFLPPKHYYQEEDEPAFTIHPSPSLPKKIAAVRFLTHFVRDYLSKCSKLDYFPKISFSCGFSWIPSNLLINFISLSILPNSDSFPSDLKLNNANFSKVLNFANSVFQTNSKVFSINSDRFEFTTIFSIVLSSKIRYVFARNLLVILNNPSSFYSSLHLFSIKELEFAEEFIKSEELNECKNASVESTVLFLNKLFSVNLIELFDEDEEKPKEFKRLRNLKKTPRFILQKMFIDLESSFLNILPSNIFILSAIYSYFFLKYHKNLDSNPPIQDDVQKIKQTLSKFEKIKEKLSSFNSLADILQFCNNYIYESLQKTFEFFQYFYQSYYIINFCKVSNQYEHTTIYFENFLKKTNEKIPSNLIQNFFNSLTQKLNPFPLFCLPFILFDKYSSYKMFINNFKYVDQNNPVDHSQKEEKDKDVEIFEDLPNSFDLFESNCFYSEQFRIHLSNLSLFSDFKINIVKNIDILNKFLNTEDNRVSALLSLPFFQNPFLSSKSFKFDCAEIKNCKNVLEFCVDTILETHMRQSISSFIDGFIQATTQFLQFDNEINESEYNNYISDFQLFFSPKEENKVYINSILNNFMDLINSLSISKSNLTYNMVINDEMHNSLVRLVYSVLEARFNNKVEIDPIVDLIPKYIEIFTNSSDWSNPTEQEFMALCSAIKFTLSSTDKFRKRSSSIIPNENEKEIVDDYYSPVKAGNYRNEFSDNDDRNDPVLMKDTKYKTSVDEALALSDVDIYDIRKRYDVRNKKWTEIIWSIFNDFFNKKLKEINLNFDKNNKYSQGYACIHCLANENLVIMNHLPQLENMKDFHDKEVWIGRFISLHKNYEYQIKSAYVYALMSSYTFLKTYYTFDDI